MIFRRAKQPPATIVILGMHRSGTSLVAGLVGALGVHLGDELLGPNRDNPTGHFEPVEIIDLNDRILAAAGGTWFNPPSAAAIGKAGRSFRKQVASWVRERNVTHAVWGWKDPRTALTFDLFRPYLRRPRLLVVRRAASDVARSLEKRDGTDRYANLTLCEAYNQRIDDVLRRSRLPRLEVHYDSVRRDPGGELQRIARYTGKQLTPAELRHHAEFVLDESELEGAKAHFNESGRGDD